MISVKSRTKGIAKSRWSSALTLASFCFSFASIAANSSAETIRWSPISTRNRFAIFDSRTGGYVSGSVRTTMTSRPPAMIEGI